MFKYILYFNVRLSMLLHTAISLYTLLVIHHRVIHSGFRPLGPILALQIVEFPLEQVTLGSTAALLTTSVATCVAGRNYALQKLFLATTWPNVLSSLSSNAFRHNQLPLGRASNKTKKQREILLQIETSTGRLEIDARIRKLHKKENFRKVLSATVRSSPALAI